MTTNNNIQKTENASVPNTSSEIQFKSRCGISLVLRPDTRECTISSINYTITFDYAEDFSVSHHVYSYPITRSVVEFRMFGDRLVGTINNNTEFFRVCPICGEIETVRIVKNAILVTPCNDVIEGAEIEYKCSNCSGTFHDRVTTNEYGFNLTYEC